MPLAHWSQVEMAEILQMTYKTVYNEFPAVDYWYLDSMT